MDGTICKAGNVILDLHPASNIELNADLSLGHNLQQGSSAETYLIMHRNSKLIVNGYFKALYNSSIEVFPGGTLTLNGGYINCGTVITCAKSITIGEGAGIARGVYIYDTDHNQVLDKNGEPINPPAPVVIGKHVWIGIGAIILKGVTIGDGAIIGAGAIVSHDVPARCLAAGSPARVIRENVEWRHPPRLVWADGESR